MATKNYCGNGWAHPKFENTINITVNLEKLQAMPVNSYGDIKLTVSKMKEPNAKTKATHTVYENDYVPQGEQTRPDNDITGGRDNDGDGLPF
jgi:hypothetical protein